MKKRYSHVRVEARQRSVPFARECNTHSRNRCATSSLRGKLLPFGPRALDTSMGRELFGELHLEIPLHFI
jgi:hypothetical protein